MAQVSGVTPGKLADMETEMGHSLVSGSVDASGQLLLTTRDGAVIVAGSVTSASGGDPGAVDESVTVSFASPSTTWTCVHNLNHQFVDVTCYTPDGSVVEGDVTYNDANTCTITWYYPTAGNAFIQR